MSLNNKFVAVIPARGGSKRLPGKNIKLFSGLPLIEYTIRFAQRQDGISKVVVTTDDGDIKAVSLALGAEVIDRPESISGDHATTASAIKHVLSELAKRGHLFDYAVTLQVTNPLRPSDLFVEAVALLEQYSPADSVISVSKSALKLGIIEDNCFIPANYTPGQRSQDMKAQFYENGLIYITKASVIIEQEDIFGANICPYIVEENLPIVDIDDQKDFDYGEFVLQRNSNLFSYLS